MSDTNDDPLLVLLTDIAEGVAVLAERIDAMEARAAAQDTAVNEALETIAEITMRTYYATKPGDELPADVVNAHVMDRSIERWPENATVGLNPSTREQLQDLGKHDTKTLDAMVVKIAGAAPASNAVRIRQAFMLRILNHEIQKRFKTYERSLERERDLGRSR